MRRLAIFSVAADGELGRCRMDGRHKHAVVDLKTGRVLSFHRDYRAARRHLARRGYKPEAPQ